jgi:hypothetical protein
MVTLAMQIVRLMGAKAVSRGLRYAWSDAVEMRAALTQLDA